MTTRSLLLAICLLITMPALAQSGFYLGPEVGNTFFDSERDLDDNVGYGLLGGYQFDNRWAAELEYYTTEPDFEDTPPGGEAELDRWSAHARYLFGTGNWRPFILGGLGGQETDTDFGDDSETLITLGAGVEGALSDHWRLRGDARAFHSHDDSFTDYGVHLTLAYFFGEAREPRAPAQPEPMAREPAPAPVAERRPEPRPAPPPEPRTREVRYVLNILFPHNSAEVRDRYSNELEEIAALMKEHPETTVIIEGHTDNTGAAAYNQELSERRAHAVKDKLVEDHGIATGRLNAVGFGEERPVADNSTAEGRAVNRRIEAVVTYQETLPPEEYQP